MIKVDIQIGSGDRADSLQKWGLTYIKADDIFGPPLKERKKVAYDGQEGEQLDRRAVMAPFDYKVQFAIQGDNKESANRKLMRFNNALVESTQDDVMTFHRIKIFNPFKGVMISGVPDFISEADAYWRDDISSIIADLKIRVDRPSQCDFEYGNGYESKMPIKLSLQTDGEKIYISTSRPLESDEHVALLRRGKSHRPTRRKRMNRPAQALIFIRKASRNKWHVNQRPSVLYDDGSLGVFVNGKDETIPLAAYCSWESITKKRYRIKRCAGSYRLVPALAGVSARQIFGLAVYKSGKSKWGMVGTRLSNVAYFWSCIEFSASATTPNTVEAAAHFEI